MREKLSDCLWRLKRLLSRGLARRRRDSALPPPPVKGNMRNVIVVRPEGGMFSEAMFILRDEYVTNQEISSQELLRQAREAAGCWSAQLGGRRRGRGLLLSALAGGIILLLAAKFLFF